MREEGQETTVMMSAEGMRNGVADRRLLVACDRRMHKQERVQVHSWNSNPMKVMGKKVAPCKHIIRCSRLTHQQAAGRKSCDFTSEDGLVDTRPFVTGTIVLRAVLPIHLTINHKEKEDT